MAHDDAPPPPPAPPVSPEAVAATRPRRPDGDGLRAAHLYRAVGLAFALALVFRFFGPLSEALLLGYAAVILAVLLNAIRERLRVKRQWMAAGVGLLTLAAVVGALIVAGPLLADQVRGLADTVPALQRQAAEWAAWVRRTTGFEVTIPSPAVLLRNVGGAGSVVGPVMTAAQVVVYVVLLFFGALFALAQPNDRLLNPLLRTVRPELRPAVYRICQLLSQRLVGWLKGTITAMVAVGLLSVAAFTLIGVPNALALGLLNGLLEFIPIVGPWTGGVVATLVASLDGAQTAAWTALASIVIQQVEANVITPWAMSRNAEIHPFVTLFALLVFGGLFGFLGLLLALPLVLLVWTVVQVLWVERAIDTDRDRIAPVAAE